MKKLLIFGIILISISVGVIAVLGYNGYLFIDHTVIPPKSSFKWSEYGNDSNIINIDESNNSSYDFSIFSKITEKLKTIKGIENINYQIFISNESLTDIKKYYKTILKELDYEYHDEYNGVIFYDFFELDYFTFINGFNGVVIFLTSYNSYSWICYSTGHVLDYQNILDHIHEKI